MIVAEIIMVAGAFLVFVSAVGVTRFRDVLARMHALSKASTMGFVGVMVGAALGLDDHHDVALVALAALLQVLTSPISANLMSRATYLSIGVERRVDDTDELAGD